MRDHRQSFDEEVLIRDEHELSESFDTARNGKLLMFGQTDDTYVRNALHGQPDTEKPFPTTFNIRKKKNIEQQKKELEIIAKKQEEANQMA